MEARNLLASAYNTQVFFSALESVESPVEVHVGFRVEGRSEFKIQDQFHILPGQSFPFERNYRLSTGSYQLEVSMGDLTSLPIQLPYECNNEDQGLFVSDIYLSSSSFAEMKGRIIHFSKIDVHQQDIFFRCELLSERFEQLTARAVLYRERTKGTQAKATVFTSIEQQNKVLNLTSGESIFQGEFSLQTLNAGDYLLEVLVFEDDQLLRERSVRFSKDWQGYAGLMANLDRAIEMLEPIADKSEIHRMINIEEESGKRLAFENWWEKYTSEAQSLQIATYYQKLFEADSLFADALPAWKSDRGRTYLLYGKPNRQELVKSGERFERWYYEDWNLVLWFKEEGANFVSIK